MSSFLKRLREGVAASAEPQVQRAGVRPNDQDADDEKAAGKGKKPPPDAAADDDAKPAREADTSDVVGDAASGAAAAVADSNESGDGDPPDTEADGADVEDTDANEDTDTGTPDANASTITCPLCDGAGTWEGKVCPGCDGNKSLDLSQLADASIPLTESSAIAKLSESTPLIAKKQDGAEGDEVVYDVVLIKEGLGDPEDGNYYTREALREAVQAGLFEGLRAFSNHPTPTEERERPERDVKQLVGHYRNARYQEAGGRGQVAGEFVPVKGDSYRWVTDLIDSAIAARGHTPDKPLIGISIDGAGIVEPGEFREGMFGGGRPGQRISLVREVAILPSADVVTRPGAGGEFISRLRESLRHLGPSRPDTPAKEGRMKPAQLQEKVKAATAKLREALKGLRDAESDDAVAASLKTATDAHDELTTLGDQPVEVEIREVEKPVAAKPDDEKDQLQVRLREVETERDDQKKRADEAEKKVASHDRGLLAAKVLRETKVPEHLVTLEELAELEDEDAMRAHVKREQDREKGILDRFRESTTRIEGSPPRVPVTTGGGSNGSRSVGADLGIHEDDLRTESDDS